MNKFLKQKRPEHNPIYSYYSSNGRRQSTSSGKNDGPPPSDFNAENGKILKFPAKPTLRTYQERAVLKCIRSNTLVCLPTGSGKTLIGATVIKNFLSWYPKGQGELTLLFLRDFFYSFRNMNFL